MIGPSHIAAMRRGMEREDRVFDLIARGRTYAQIAEELGITRDAVAGLVHRRKRRPERLQALGRMAPQRTVRPPVAPVYPALLKLAPFDPLARRLVEERTAHAPRD